MIASFKLISNKNEYTNQQPILEEMPVPDFGVFFLIFIQNSPPPSQNVEYIRLIHHKSESMLIFLKKSKENTNFDYTSNIGFLITNRQRVRSSAGSVCLFP